jgi:lipoprotein-anchoring transpeptidase ErfK/SrfK
MPDYYAILWRALKKGDCANAQWRNDVFDRMPQVLLDQLRARRPPLSSVDIKLHKDALEAAIKIIQSEFAQNGGRNGLDAEPKLPPQRELVGESLPPEPNAPPFWFKRIVWAAVAVVVAAVIAGVYALQATRHSSWSPPASNAGATSDRAAPRPSLPKHRPSTATTADGDLAPGVDGGSTDAEVSFVFRRQPVFYRTTHPVGTIIIDKQQHFLYLIQPNLVALRYGIGVGKPCADVAGLRRVSTKVEWPEWHPPAEMVERKLTLSDTMPGGLGNPFGARLIGLDDGSSRVHGTNAPKTIGNSVNSGCIRLVNDEVVDLYNRVSMGARVIFGD